MPMNRIKYPIMVCAFAIISTLCVAQTASKPLRIVFDVTSGDTLVHQAAIRHLNAESKAHPEGQFEVVIYGGALNMLLKDKSSVASGVMKLLDARNVSFMVCEETMHRHKVEKSQLITGVRTVPDGIVEIVEKEAAGWGYIKEAH